MAGRSLLNAPPRIISEDGTEEGKESPAGYPGANAFSTGTRKMSTSNITEPAFPFSSSVLSNSVGTRSFVTFPSPAPQFDSKDDAISGIIERKANETREIQSQIDHFQVSTEQVRSERQSKESELARLSAQKHELTSRLADVKSAYEAEVKLSVEADTKHSGQLDDVNKLRSELQKLEQDFAKLHIEKEQLRNTMMSDRMEVESMKKRLKELPEELKVLRAEVDRLRKDRKHERGMFEISRQMLTKAEQEKTELLDELSDQRPGEIPHGQRPAGMMYPPGAGTARSVTGSVEGDSIFQPPPPSSFANFEEAFSGSSSPTKAPFGQTGNVSGEGASPNKNNIFKQSQSATMFGNIPDNISVR